MPNMFAFVVLLSWPVVVLLLFRSLPRAEALCWSVIGGYLLLPPATAIDLPVLPSIDKTLLPSVTAALMCLVTPEEKPGPKRGRTPARRAAAGATAAAANLARRTSRGGVVITLLIALLVVTPFFTAMTNSNPLFYGPRYVNGLRLYDSLSMILSALVLILPFLLGRRYLATPDTHRTLIRVLCFAGIGYSFLALFEARMSPQLNIWLYGFFAHSWDQHVRAGGYRPILFLEHGLRVGIFLAMSCLATLALWRHQKRQGEAAGGFLAAALWLGAVLAVSKNFGATAITFMLVAPMMVLRVRAQVFVAGALAGAVLLFPMLRNLGAVPFEAVVSAAEIINPTRASSLQFRFWNEEQLLQWAQQKPLFGWGGWGRSLLYDAATGARTIIPDGAWVIVFGVSGWMGYIAHFGLLTLPVIGLALRQKRLGLSFATTGLALILAANLVDLIPNSSMTAPIWLIAGALAGRYEWETVPTLQAKPQRAAGRGPGGGRRRPGLARS